MSRRHGSPSLSSRPEGSTVWPSPVLRFARDSRGGAAIECGLGAAVLVSVAALCFDLYSRVAADTAVARMAVTMADYVSHDVAPNGDQMKELGAFLRDHELHSRAHVVYVTTAIHQPPGTPLPPVRKLWSEDQKLRFGDGTATGELAGACARHIGDGGVPSLPEEFAPMQENEVVIIVEVCARLTGAGFVTQALVAGDTYRLHAVPARDASQVPAAPVFST